MVVGAYAGLLIPADRLPRVLSVVLWKHKPSAQEGKRPRICTVWRFACILTAPWALSTLRPPCAPKMSQIKQGQKAKKQGQQHPPGAVRGEAGGDVGAPERRVLGPGASVLGERGVVRLPDVAGAVPTEFKELMRPIQGAVKKAQAARRGRLFAAHGVRMPWRETMMTFSRVSEDAFGGVGAPAASSASSGTMPAARHESTYKQMCAIIDSIVSRRT